MVKVFSVNYQSVIKCTNCFLSSVILSHLCQKMSGEKCEKCVVDFREPSKGLVYNASDCSPRGNVAMLF